MKWKSIPGFDVYEVSDTGLIRSVDRWIYPKTGDKYYLCGCILRQHSNRNGYLRVALYKEGVGKTRDIHRLVTLAFLGPCPAGMEVRHLDGSRTNNNLANLKYGTLSQNQQDRFKHGTACIGEKHPLCALTDKQVQRIRCEYSKGKSTMQQLADRYDVVPSTIWRVVNKHRRITNEKVRI